MEALGGVGVTHYAVSNHYFLGAVVKVAHVKNPVSLSKKYFFSIKLLHAYLQYVCNISTKCWKDPMKALRGVGFTKYALSSIIYLVQVSEND